MIDIFNIGTHQMKIFYKLIITGALILLSSCSGVSGKKVEVVKTSDGYQLYRDGKPYFIKGAGGSSHFEMVAEYGGNSIRTWGVNDWDKTFKFAEEHNLTVCAGMWMEQERQGFDYSDPDTVKMQFERLKSAILKYKDHPSLLVWGIGNELDLMYTNPAVWDAVEDVAAFIHKVDGNHPTMTVTTFARQDVVNQIKEKCPSIDILGINVYAALPVLDKFLQDFGWDGPYIVGEWGTFGHWEVAKTSWNEPIEYNSGQKADLYLKGYQEHILDQANCLGSYVFLWDNKQERTATWYSMFLPTGEKTEVVDVMWHNWKDGWPQNRSPRLSGLLMNGLKASESITVKPGSLQNAEVIVTDSENDELRITWEVLYETTDKRTGGDVEQKPAIVDDLDLKPDNNKVSFKAPAEEGPYRLFVYVYDQKGGAAHANIPFLVKK